MGKTHQISKHKTEKKKMYGEIKKDSGSKGLASKLLLGEPNLWSASLFVSYI